MILHGDEVGRTQGGNNNVYCQDNETSWVDWEHVDEGLLAFTQPVTRLRAEHPVFRRRRFFTGDIAGNGLPDIAWLASDGTPMDEDDWTSPQRRAAGRLPQRPRHRRARPARRDDRRRLVPDPLQPHARGHGGDAAGRGLRLDLERRARHRRRRRRGRAGGGLAARTSARARSSCSGMTDGRGLGSTYRLQLHAGFDVRRRGGDRPVPRAARRLAPLPVADPAGRAAARSTATTSSTTAASRTELGGRPGFARAGGVRARARARDHRRRRPEPHGRCPTPEYLNRQLWDLLRLGRDAPSAHWFDVDWEFGGGRIGLPVLGAPLADVLAAGDLVDRPHDGEPVLELLRAPLPARARAATSARRSTRCSRPSTTRSPRGATRTTCSTTAASSTSTRLIAIRVELDDVFDATHAVLLELHPRGRRSTASGSTIPTGSPIRRPTSSGCDDATGGAWIVVEKILAPGRGAAARLAVLGHDGVRRDARDPGRARAAGRRRELDERWRATGGEPSLERVEIEAKGLVVRNLFEPEVRRLARSAGRRGGRRARARRLRGGACASCSRTSRSYRAYLRPGRAGRRRTRLARLERMAGARRALAARPRRHARALAAAARRHARRRRPRAATSSSASSRSAGRSWPRASRTRRSTAGTA